MPKNLEHSTTAWTGQGLSHRNGVFTRTDARLRIVWVCAFAIIATLLTHVGLLLFSCVISVALAFAVGLPLARTMRRVLAMDLFMLFILLLLPFSVPGDPLFTVAGYVASWQGLNQAILILLKANTILVALLALIGTLEANDLGRALARLGVSHKLVLMMLFTVRYLDVMGREYRRMRQCMKARAFTPKSNLHTWKSFGYLVGMLLVRSMERAERAHMAMKCRGFTGQFVIIDQFVWETMDTKMAIAGTSVLLLVATLGYVL